jgi:MFS transporter, ACS family, D-galactonate transporter
VVVAENEDDVGFIGGGGIRKEQERNQLFDREQPRRTLITRIQKIRVLRGSFCPLSLRRGRAVRSAVAVWLTCECGSAKFHALIDRLPPLCHNVPRHFSQGDRSDVKPARTDDLSAVSRWLIVLLLMGYAGLAHYNRVGITVAGSEVFIRQYGISETKMGWVYTAFLIVYTLGMLPGGWLIDRIGSSRALAILGVSMGSFVMLTGTLGWVMTGPEQLWLGLLVIRSLAGLCSAPLHPGAAHVVSDVTHHGGRATANGLITAGAVVGIAFSFPVFGWLKDTLTWPWAFVVSGAVLFMYGLLWMRVAVPRLPGPAEEAAAELDSLESNPAPTAWSAAQLMFSLQLNLLTLSYAAYSYFQYLFFYWINFYFASVLKVPDVESRRIAFYITLAQGAGMALGGIATDVLCRLFGRTVGRRTVVLVGMGASAILALIAVQLKDYQQVALFFAIAMGTQGMCEGVFWTTATDIGGRSRGFSGAFMNTGGNAGGLISPVLTPAMATYIGWPGSIAIACAISGIGGLVWFWIKPPAAEVTGNQSGRL